MQATTEKQTPKSPPLPATGLRLRQVWFYDKDSVNPLAPSPGWVIGESKTAPGTVNVTVLVSAEDQLRWGNMAARTVKDVPIVKSFVPKHPSEVKWPAGAFAIEVEA